MKIYVGHSMSMDFKNELYTPVQDSELSSQHEFVCPHENSDCQFDSLSFFKNDCELVIAEVSVPSYGLGIELGWASLLNIPIVMLCKKDVKVSSALSVISDNFIEYNSAEDMVSQLTEVIESF